MDTDNETRHVTNQLPPEKLAKGLEKWVLQDIDGCLYNPEMDTEDMAVQMELVRNLHVRDDDVIIFGFPRSGNQWTLEVVQMIMKQKTEYFQKPFNRWLIELMGNDVQKKLDALPSPRVYSCHFRLHRMPSEALQKHNKIIYVIRNPKDVVVSLYKLKSSYAMEHKTFKGTWAEFFDTFLASRFAWGSWFDHVLAAEEFMMQNPDVPVYVASFEAMKRDSLVAIRDLCHFLGKPETLVEEIAKATEFATMRTKTVERQKEFVQEWLTVGAEGFLRSGGTGGWKNWFTVAQNEAFDRYFKEKMSNSKLIHLFLDYL